MKWRKTEEGREECKRKTNNQERQINDEDFGHGLGKDMAKKNMYSFFFRYLILFLLREREAEREEENDEGDR